MTYIYKTFALFAIAMGAYAEVNAQPVKYTQTLNAAGGSKNIASNNYERSVGEMALVNTGTGSNIIVTQGVLQPAQSSGNVANTRRIENISVYPVPSKNTIHLQYDFPVQGKLQYELMDIAGKSLSKNTTAVSHGKQKQSIDLERFANGSYMLYVNFTDSYGIQSVSSFKVEKIN